MLLVSLIHVLLMKKLTFPIDTEIPHLFCELAQVLKVAHSDIFISNIFLYVVAALVVIFPVTGILVSYFQIVCTLVRMSSIASKNKAFSICGSHICVVSLFYGTAFGAYFSSDVTHLSQRSTIASVMYTVVTPMLNPFIYSVRNKDAKGALGRLLSRAVSCPSWITELRAKSAVWSLRQ
jgi:olfactory receptor